MMPALRLILAIVLHTSALRAGGWLDEFWPEAKIYIKTSPTSRVFLQAARTRTSENGFSEGQLGAHMDFYFSPFIKKDRPLRHPDVSRSKMIMLRAGYYFNRTPKDSPDPFTEHSGMIEVTPRFFLPKQILVENRFRGDLRFLDGVFTPRFRDRLRIERPFKIPRTTLNPYAEVEVFYDWRYGSFHRQRYDAGVEWIAHPRFILEPYYLRQHDSRSSNRWIDVAGVVLQFYFR